MGVAVDNGYLKTAALQSHRRGAASNTGTDNNNFFASNRGGLFYQIPGQFGY